MFRMISRMPGLSPWALLAALLLALPVPALAQAADRAEIAGRFCQGGEALTAVSADLLAIAAGDDKGDMAWGHAMVTAASNAQLICGGAGEVFVTSASGEVIDAATGEAVTPAGDTVAPVINLKNRRILEVVDAALMLRSAPARADREAALALLERRMGDLPANLFEKAAAEEPDPGLRLAIQSAAESALLRSPDPEQRIAAIRNLVAKSANSRTLSLIEALRGDDAYARDAAFAREVDRAVASISRTVMIGDVLSTLYSGLSYASILFLASIGLAIIFGLMGVINLAQGEFIMIGAYSTWLVQEFLHRFAPPLAEWYLLLAIPVAFLVTAGVGLILEVTLLRFLYRRPLMSLIATWAVSLLLINLVRVTFGTQNMQFDMPFYITGGVPLIGDFVFTWNRMFAVGFACVTLAMAWYIIRYTPLGLNIRAVTQNRDMAGCVGVPTRRVDLVAFGFGSGLAGLAGLALAPIFSVNPLMGQNFIIDSFMVVVLGGVGTLSGTVIAALGVGQVNVLIEPFYGAVAAKVIVLAMIIVFLQWRPEGLFILRGRRK